MNCEVYYVKNRIMVKKNVNYKNSIKIQLIEIWNNPIKLNAYCPFTAKCLWKTRT